MAIIKNENYDIELIFLLSHPSDLNLTLKILDYILDKSYLILIQRNRFSSKISSILDKKSIKNYQVFDNEVRYGDKNIFKNIYYSYKLKYFFTRFKHTKLIIFDFQS